METGIYILTRDVVNPCPDRRSKDWHKKPIFPCGLQIRVKRRLEDYVWFSSGRWDHDGFTENDERAKAISVALKPVEINRVELLFEYLQHLEVLYPDGIEVLQVLVDKGKITLGEIEEIVRNSEAE